MLLINNLLIMFAFAMFTNNAANKEFNEKGKKVEVQVEETSSFNEEVKLS